MLKAVFVTLLVLSFGTPALSSTDAISDITQREQDFNAAYAANDFDKCFGCYTDHAVFWFPEGRTDVPGYKKEWREFLEVKMDPKGDSAIASYDLHLTQREPDKKVHTEDWQESDIWFQTAGGWKITHVHYAAAPMPAKKK